MKTLLPHSSSDFSAEDEMKHQSKSRSFKTISKEELETLFNDPKFIADMEEALEKGRKEAEAARRAFVPPRIRTDLRFT